MKFQMLGSADKPGPVRLSDVYSSQVGDASTGIAASQKALYDAYNSLNSSISNLNTSVSGINSLLTTLNSIAIYRGPSAPKNVNEVAYNTICWANNSNGQSHTNLPTGAYHLFTVETANSHAFQLGIEYTGAKMILRTIHGSTWGAWKTVTFS